MIKDNIPLIRPCWYKDLFGQKCPNSGAPISLLEKIVLDEIAYYQDSFVTEIDSRQENSFDAFQKKLEESQVLLAKKKKALDLLNDTYKKSA